MKTIQRLRLDSFLSFRPGSEAIDLEPLNVLIGPNGSGKSNVIEAIELLHAAPTDLSAAIRDGGGAEEWLWKGRDPGPEQAATIDVELSAGTPTGRPLRYRLEFTSVQGHTEVLDEVIEEATVGRPADEVHKRRLPCETVRPDQSVLAQRTDPERHPEITWVGEHFGAMRTCREWTRRPGDASTLALVLSRIEHRDGRRFDDLLAQFFPRYERMSTCICRATAQFYIHETGFRGPIPATRLSDGTIRFIAILAVLLSPSPPPLACIEEPELGLHPDAAALLVDLLVEASKRMQLIVTTHSDALISELTNQPEAVITCERPGEGTILNRLDPERLRSWLDEYRLGDLWRMGELGANP